MESTHYHKITINRTVPDISRLVGIAGKTGRQMSIFTAMILILPMLSPMAANAQTGTVIGTIIDAETGESLPGATVSVQGTITGTTSDIDGRYTLRRVPSGDQVIEFRSMGYTTQLIPVNVEDDDRIQLDIALVGDLIIGDDIIVVARQRGQARALTRQRQSVNIRSVVSAEQMDAFGDQTVSESLSRIAGMGHGSGNIRGVGAGASNITMDGQRMGSTSSDRSVDLGTISADMVQEMDVIKVITPDMNADALAGVINISTRRPVGGERSVNVRLGGGWNPRFTEPAGVATRASFSYGDSPRSDFSYGLNFSYQREPRASESVNTSWDWRNFGEGPRDVIASMNTELQFDPRERYGTGLQFTFQPDDRTTFHVQGMFNYQDREQMRYGMRFNPTVSDWISENQTRSPHTANGNFGYITRLDEYDIHQYTVQAGGRHLFDGFDMDYKLGWGHGHLFQERYEFVFRTDSRYEFFAEFDDRWAPRMGPGIYSERPNYPTAEQLIFRGVDNRFDSHKDNEFTARLDVESPYSRGNLKFGTSAILTFKEGGHERLDMSTGQRASVEDFELLINRDWRVFDRDHQTYYIPWIVDLHKAREWYYGTYPLLTMNYQTWVTNSETGDFSAHEHTYAAYGMGTYELGKFRFLGGARVEHTDARYDGRDGTIDAAGNFRGAVDVSNVNRYTNIFPNAQLVYALGRLSNIRLAYSRSIGRPTFSQLSPSTMRNYSSETLIQGNADLKPMLSHNLDLLFEHYFLNVGQFTLGFYYKELSNFVYSYRDRIGPDGLEGSGEYVGWQWTTFRNGQEATVYGMEVTWQQNLSFLPGFLSNLGTYANYAYAQSIAELDRPGSTRLQDQRPHVVNVGLDYSQGAFSSQLSYQWAAPSISSYSDLRWVPGIQTDRRVYFDSYRDAANDLSLTLRYRLTSAFRIWVDTNNILNYRSVSYNYDRDFYPSSATFSGRTINIGIRYSL